MGALVLRGARTTIATVTCPHPSEERQRVFEGQERPRADRMLCGLCGELLYLAAHLAGLDFDRAAREAAAVIAARAEREPVR